jgi:hypothetical protein
MGSGRYGSGVSNISSHSGSRGAFEEAISCTDWPKWQDAIKVELAILKVAGTWTVIKHPENTNVIDSKWVFELSQGNR